jgi:hypothetical protein
MKPASLSLIAGLAILVPPLASRAAPIAWVGATPVAAHTDIQSGGITGLAGADFGLAAGAVHTVNNGSVDVAFASLTTGETATLANGAGVAISGFNFQANAGNGTIGGDYGTILGRHIGSFGGSPTVTLSGLTAGTRYQVQVFAMGGDANTVFVSGSPGLSVGGGNNPAGTGGFGASIVGTFTADPDGIQTLVLSGGEPVINALTIGSIFGGGPDTTPPEWTATWPQAGQLSPTSITVRAKTNEAGNVFYIVLPDGATAPSAAQVKAGTNSGNTPVLASGSLALTANIEATGPVTGLTANTSYDVYFVAEDAVPNLQASPSRVSVTLATATTETFSNQSATRWGTGLTASPQTGTASSKTVHFVSAATGIEFDVTLATASGNLQLRAVSGANAAPRDYLADSGGDGNWFEGPLTITVNNFTGANPADITFRLLDISGQRLVTNDVSFTSNATPVSATKSLGAPSAWGGLFTGIPLDSTAANMAGGSYTATLTWVNIDSESSGLFKDLSFEVGLGSGGANTFADWIGTFTGLNGLTGFDDDADGDGLDNGLENFLGTAPNAGNAGLTAGALGGNTLTFTHRQNANPASDVSAPVYTWSTDLATFHASGTPSGGITVDLAPETNIPSAGTTTVIATVTGTVPAKLFVRLGVTQE